MVRWLWTRRVEVEPNLNYQEKTRYFEDGLRKIDFVFAYRKELDEEKEAENYKLRQRFLKKLINEGIEIEDTAGHEKIENDFRKNTGCFRSWINCKTFFSKYIGFFQKN